MSMTEYTRPPTWAEIRAWWLTRTPTTGASEKFDRERNFIDWEEANAVDHSVSAPQRIANDTLAAIKADPHAALEILSMIEGVIRDHDGPVATPTLDDEGDMVIRVDGHGDYSPDSLFVADVSQRWTYPGVDRIDAEEQTVSPDYDGTEDYHGLAYFIEAHPRPLLVSLPDGWEEI